MKKKRYSEEQIVRILLEAEKQEKPIAEFCKLGGFFGTKIVLLKILV